jgi:hypothetical protein
MKREQEMEVTLHPRSSFARRATIARFRRRFSAGIACWNKLEIAPPSFSNHSRYGTLEDVCVL